MKRLLILALFALPAFGACQTGFISVVDAFLNPDGSAWTGAITYTLAYNTTVAGATVVGARQNFNVTNGFNRCLAPGLYNPVTLQQSGQRYPITTTWSVGVAGPYTYAQISGSATFTSTLQVGATIFVDAVYGSDSTGQRGNAGLPFKTIRAAIVATGILSGDTVHVGPGTYNETSVANTEVVFPDGVSLLCDPGATLSQTTVSTFIVAFIPGSNSTWSGCTFSGNQNRTPQMAPLGIDANLTGTIPTNVTLRNLTVNGGSDSLYLRATNTVATAAHWTIYNCTFNSHFDSFVVITLHTSGADTPWPIVVDLYNSTFSATYNSLDAGTTYRGVVSDTTGATVNVYGGTASAAGGVSGEAAGVWNRGGSTINLFNPTISSSALGASTYSVHNVYSALRSSPSQIINIYPGTAYNALAILNDSGAGAGVINSGFASAGITFANIGTPTAGASKWVSDATPGTSPCSGSGNGAWAFATSTAPATYQWRCQ